MKKISIFTAIVALAASVVLASPGAVLAQYTSYLGTTGPNTVYGSTPTTYPGATYNYNVPTSNYTYPVTATPICTVLTYDLYSGLRDVTTAGQVTILQSFLIAKGYLVVAAPTGYFGALTSAAVRNYQYGHSLQASGYVDAATRLSIQEVSCGVNYGYNNGYNNGYNSGYNNNNYNNGYNGYGYNNYYSAPVLSSLSLTSGVVGSSVTIYGSGFDPSNNTVNFGGVTLPNIASYNGTSLTFTVPQVGNYAYPSNNAVNSQYCVYPYNNVSTYNNYNCNNATVSTYNVSVTDSRGTSNSLSFTLNGNNNCYSTNGVYNNSNCYSGSISVSNVSGPTILTAGTSGTWSMTLNNPSNSYVTVSAKWGDEGVYNYAYTGTQSATQSTYVQGQQTITFTHVYQTSGYYTVIFTATNSTGAQTSVSATVNVSGGSIYNNSQPPYLSSISPSSGRVGTQVVLYGSSFTPTGNTVHFGIGGTQNINAINGGNGIYYTIPNSVGPCDLITSSGQICAAVEQLVTPGTYPVYVSNIYGQTSTMYFTVTY